MNRPFRIASICRELPNPENSFAGLFVLRRLQALSRRADVQIIQPIPHFPALRPFPRWARAQHHETDGASIRHAPMFYVPKYLKSLDGLWLSRSITRILRTLRTSNNIDIVDAHFGYPEGVGCYVAARRLGLPVFITLRGLEAEYLAKPFIRNQLAYAMRNADGCICVSRTLEALAIEAGAAPGKVRVIHNAVDKRLFRPGSKAAARQRLGLGEHAPIVISVGNLLSVKRHEVLIRAFAYAVHNHPDAKLVIVGGQKHESSYPQRLVEEAEACGVRSAVRFLGSRVPDEVAEWLRAADVFALASRREGCCNAILEALACGLPVVATPAGDNASFVRDGVNGFIVPFDDSEALGEGLRGALARAAWDPEHIARSLQVGDWDQVAGEVLDFFRARTAPAVGLPAGIQVRR